MFDLNFCNIKYLELLLLILLGAPVFFQCYPENAIPIYTPGWREGRVESLAHEHNTVTLAGVQFVTSSSGVKHHYATVPSILPCLIIIT